MASKLQPDQPNDLLYVKKGNMYCGYRREYLSQNLTKMEERYVTCKKCSGIMREASLSNDNTSCLVCSETSKQPNPVKDVQESIEMLGIRCPLLEHCKWEGELSEAETHLKECLFFQIQCKECDQIFPRKDREEHQKKSCPKRIIDCDYCSKRGKAEDEDRHLQLCDEYPISCPNECGAEFPREALSLHRSKCELEVVTCPYEEYGCEAESMLRKDLLAHKKEFYIEHQDMSLVEIKQLKWEIRTMKQLDGVEWEIRIIGGLKLDGEVEGPTFYINNYNLRIYCCACQVIGDNICKLHFHLKRIEGKFDRNLGVAYITHYRVIKVNLEDYNESGYEEGTIYYQLKIGTKSEMFSSFTQTQGNSLRFYFDINSSPMLSLDVNHPSVGDSGLAEVTFEDDPWEYMCSLSDEC